jgi:hypothetical protein
MVLGLVLAAPAIACADSFDPISIGVSANTLGFGVTLERPLLFDLSARVATGLLSNSDEHSYDGNPYTRTNRENNVLVAMDWRPYAGRWRLSGGIVLGGDHVDYTARDNGGGYLLNGNRYPVATAGTVMSRVSYARPALYAGVGGGTGIVHGMTISFDIGAVLRNGTLETSASGPLQSNAQFQRDLTTTATQFKTRYLQPVIGVGLTYRP